MGEGQPLRIGVLGAAQIVPMALIKPAASVSGVHVAAVAARDPARARQFAQKHGIPIVHPTYDALIADPQIDAIYNPLPNSLHCEWSIRALEAGKHVLCEKPMASNADEAQQMADAAQRTGRLLAEAFHYRYHPLAARLRAIIDSGALGTVRHIEAHMCIPLPIPGNIRYRYDLAGGAAMDTGCYAISLVRYLAGAEPEVVSARARLSSPQVDRWMSAEMRFPDGRTGRITCSLFSAVLLRVSARVRGERGDLAILNPFAPQFPHRIRVRSTDGTTVERVPERTDLHTSAARVCRRRARWPANANRSAQRDREHARHRCGVREGGVEAPWHGARVSARVHGPDSWRAVLPHRQAPQKRRPPDGSPWFDSAGERVVSLVSYPLRTDVMALSGAQKRYLRALAHALKPVVMVGQRGVTDRLLTQVDHALTDHELIKVKLLQECPADRDEVGTQLQKGSGADCAGAIGRVLILYRARPETPTIQLPAKRVRHEEPV